MKVIVVSKITNYQRYLDTKDPAIQQLFDSGDASVVNWKGAHASHLETILGVQSALDSVGADVMYIDGAHKSFNASNADLVITVGGDGTVLAASHHVNDVPILGINSDPERSVGIFCAANSSNLDSAIKKALLKNRVETTLNRMQVTVNGNLISKHILNEALFCELNPAATSRYILGFNHGSCEHKEEQRSSGIWVSTAAGSTGAIRSAGGEILFLTSQNLQLMVREPCVPQGKGPYRINRLLISECEKLHIHRKMSSARLYLDGPYMETPIGLGDKIVMESSDEPLTILG